MVSFLSTLTAIAVYGRISELGYANTSAIICGVIVGVLAHWAFTSVKKYAQQQEQGQGNRR